MVACAASNISKGDRLVEEWFTRRFQGQRALMLHGFGKPWVKRIDKARRRDFTKSLAHKWGTGRGR